ncbi:MAG: type I-U CRISPR-associated protein Csb2 [Candidatus Binatia bacterium]
MVTLRITLPHGRYHATPWGHHVNEGLVEWPPSPWRLLRALVSTGYTKLGWTEMPPEAVDLVTTLATTLPLYRLPPATAAHSRHWMPTKAKKTKVIDAFVRTEIGAAIGVQWSCTLPPAAHDLLRALVERLGYLGRAESWVSASVVPDDALPGGIEARPSERAIDGFESIRLIAPMPPDEYAAWREEYLRGAAAQTPRKKARGKINEPLLPPDVARALEADTSTLQAAGWSAPPGARHVLYWRPEGALDYRTHSRRIRALRRPRPDTALLALSSDTSRAEVLPLFGRALPQAELLHRALVSKLGDPPQDCPELSGKDADGQKLLGHQHVHFVPLDLDGKRRLDHVLLWAPMGFGAVAESTIRSLRRTWTKGGDKPLFVTLVGIGRREEFAVLGGKPLAEIGEARIWVSSTPFVPPRHMKAKRHTLEDQIQAELESRGLPRAAHIEVSSQDVAWKAGFHRFVLTRRHSERRPPLTAFFHLRIEFDSAARGPLMLGYASHFGLGQFRAIDD